MEIKLIAGTRDEKVIDLVNSRVINSKGEVRNAPHEQGSCRNCSHCSKYDYD